VFALILDSLGSTELLFILAIALIFFGPRKLPQLAKSVGKSVAEFRKASEDFKRTWEREVAMETARLETTENSILDPAPNESDNATQTEEPASQWVGPATPDYVVARQSQPSPDEPATETDNNSETPTAPEPLRKHDWL
jgi:Tat protein translocase TatB subunit